MNYLDISHGYYAEDVQMRAPEPEDDEPALALDLRINCVSASISIFDDKNVLGQMQPASSQFENARPLFQNISPREVRGVKQDRHFTEVSPQTHIMHQAWPQSTSQQYQPYRRSPDSWIQHPSSSFNRYLGPEKMLGNVDQPEKQRIRPLSPGFDRDSYARSNRPSCQCSMPSCGQCFYTRGHHSPPSNLPLAAQRDRSRSPLSSPQNPNMNHTQNTRLFPHPDPALVPNELFSKSPSNRRDDSNQSKYGGYLHKRFNARSLFLSRIIQRQQDHLNELIPSQQATTCGSSPSDSELDRRLQGIEEGYRSFSQSSQNFTSSNERLMPDDLGLQNHSVYALSVSPPEVNDIDSKLNIIEKSLTERSDHIAKVMNVKQRESGQISSKCPAQPGSRRTTPPPPRAQSTQPLNLSREIELERKSPIFSLGIDSNPTRANTNSQIATESRSLHPVSPAESRSPSPLEHRGEKSDDETRKNHSINSHNLTEKTVKSRRGRPRKHVRKIPLPPLYVFIRNLLHNKSYNPNIVSWVNETQGIFKVINTIEFAKTWGLMKSHRSEEMNYEKMSRAMRYHYGSPSRKGHLAMVKEKRLVYRFGELAVKWHMGEVPVVKCTLHDLCKGCLCLWTKE